MRRPDDCRKRSTVSPRNSSAWRTDVLIWSDTLFVVVAALAFDALIGDPDWLWRRLPHPVVLIGSFIGLLDRYAQSSDAGRRRSEKLAGVSVVVLLLVVSALVRIPDRSWRCGNRVRKCAAWTGCFRR